MASSGSDKAESDRAMRTLGIGAAVVVGLILLIWFRSTLNVTWFQGILHEEKTIGQFLFVTVILGGWAAWMTGKASAQTWRPMSSLVVFLLLLGIAVRFIHHALFEGTMFTPQYYIVDTLILLAFGIVGYQHTRTEQMTTQYYWLYEKVSALSWKPKA